MPFSVPPYCLCFCREPIPLRGFPASPSFPSCKNQLKSIPCSITDASAWGLSFLTYLGARGFFVTYLFFTSYTKNPTKVRTTPYISLCCLTCLTLSLARNRYSVFLDHPSCLDRDKRDRRFWMEFLSLFIT